MPIRGGWAGGSVVAGFEGGGRQRIDYAGIRREQIRRATLLLDACGGKPLTKATAASAVARIAKTVPGLRYTVPGRRNIGIGLVHSGLAPANLIWGDDLPGRNAGRPAGSVREQKDLIKEVDALKRSQPGLKDADALRVIHRRLQTERKHPPSLKTMRNKLSIARRSTMRPE